MFKIKNLKSTQLVLLISVLNFLLFHYPFFEFVCKSLDYKSFYGLLTIVSLAIVIVALHFFIFFIVFHVSGTLGKVLITLFFILNAASVYFINAYGIIVDGVMISNILNTRYEEASSFFSFKLIFYILILGILPSVYFFKTNIIKVPFKKFIVVTGLTFSLILVLAFANAKNWLWIDKNSGKLGGLVMPWSYTANLSLYYVEYRKKNQKEIILPDATIKDNEKSVVVLVIGESARKQNFSLYGYAKNTNPLLSKTPNLFHFNATSGATYTSAGVKCILEHKPSDDLYEILPNYLNRNNVEVIWRTTNWGEPPLHIENYQNKEALKKNCTGPACDFDEVLLSGLKEQILSSKKNKILVVLHTSTSHGPSYSKKYPAQFEAFKPVCNNVDLAKCSQTELQNGYDNTIVFTDYILHNLITDLNQLNGYKKSMIFISDHGESLGENNLYMHGLPLSIAPKEQYEIPFLVWLSDNNPRAFKPNEQLTQHHIFHSVLDLLSIQSPIYDEKMTIFK
jgi:lipid A ethanolaminephosphotransferase